MFDRQEKLSPLLGKGKIRLLCLLWKIFKPSSISKIYVFQQKKVPSNEGTCLIYKLEIIQGVGVQVG